MYRHKMWQSWPFCETEARQEFAERGSYAAVQSGGSLFLPLGPRAVLTGHPVGGDPLPVVAFLTLEVTLQHGPYFSSLPLLPAMLRSPYKLNG
jgi:hypothetical protein